jgi:hypothetical protein
MNINNLSYPASKNLVWCLIVLITVLLISGCAKAPDAEAFNKQIEQFTFDSLNSKENNEPSYIKGKIVIFKEESSLISNDASGNYQIRKRGVFHPLTNSLPSDIRANRPEEVGTVVWIRYDKKFEEYVVEKGSGRPVETVYCLVTIIDKSIPLLVGGTSFKAYDKPPDKEILNYLKSLPRK